MPKLTDAAIAKLPLATKYQYTKFDELRGFGIRVSTHSKTFVLKKDNKYHTLGRWPSVTLKQARHEAHRRIALKYFPKSSPMIETAIQEYLHHQQSRLRPGSLIQFRHQIQHFPRTGALLSLTLPRLREAISHLTPSQQNHAHNIFKAFLNWCVSREYLERSPMEKAKLPHKTTSRDRTLSDEEIRTILLATSENTQLNNLVHFLVFSAQRRTQVSLTQHSFIEDKNEVPYIASVTWPKHVMKSGQPHTLALTPHLLAILRRGKTTPYCFGPTPYQAWSHGKEELDRRVNLPHWTFHDLRRTARTNMARLGIPENIAERILAHAPPKLNNVYNRYHYLHAKQEALLKLEEHYKSLLGAE